MTTEHPKTDIPGADPGINLTEQSLTADDRAAMYPTAQAQARRGIVAAEHDRMRADLSRLDAGLAERGIALTTAGPVDAALAAIDEAHRLAGRAVTSRALLQRDLDELTARLVDRDREIEQLSRALYRRTVRQPAPPHILTVHEHGWEITHPAGCTVATPTGPALICLIEDLGREQLPLVEMPPGRYEIGANPAGSRLLVSDLLDELCRCEDPADRDHGHQPGGGRHCGGQDQGEQAASGMPPCAACGTPWADHSAGQCSRYRAAEQDQAG